MEEDWNTKGDSMKELEVGLFILVPKVQQPVKHFRSRHRWYSRPRSHWTYASLGEEKYTVMEHSLAFPPLWVVSKLRLQRAISDVEC